KATRRWAGSVRLFAVIGSRTAADERRASPEAADSGGPDPRGRRPRRRPSSVPRNPAAHPQSFHLQQFVWTNIPRMVPAGFAAPRAWMLASECCRGLGRLVWDSGADFAWASAIAVSNPLPAYEARMFLDSLMGFFSTDVAMDLGTANTL